MSIILLSIANLRNQASTQRLSCISIGIMAIIMPFAIVGGDLLVNKRLQLQPSLSHYYYTNMSGLFVVSLLIFSGFLLIDSSITSREKGWSYFASICGFGTIILPTMPVGKQLNAVYILHLLFALSLFVSVAVLSIRHYATNASGITRKLFRFAGFGLLTCLIGLISFFAIVTLSGGHTVDSNVVLYIEMGMIALLGSVWLIKGVAIER